jgi:nucleoside-diphosphate-sugar epimerase
MTRVAVTGAGGFVGRALVGDLFARGFDVLGWVRRKIELGDGPETRLITDVVEEAERGGALDGVDVVVHLAARVHRAGETGEKLLDRYLEDNAAATRRVALAAARAGVERLIFVSSVKVHGDDGEHPCDEDGPTRPADAYAISKLRAEQAVAEVHAQTGLETVVLRPPLIYGPGVKANFATLLRLADTGLPLPLGAFDRNRRSYLFLGNFLGAVRGVLTEQIGRAHV